MVNKNNTYKAEQTVLTNKLTALEHKKTALVARVKKIIPNEYTRKFNDIDTAEKTATTSKTLLTEKIDALNLTMIAAPYIGIEHNLGECETKSRNELNNLTMQFVFKEDPSAKKGIFSWGKKK